MHQSFSQYKIEQGSHWLQHSYEKWFISVYKLAQALNIYHCVWLEIYQYLQFRSITDALKMDWKEIYLNGTSTTINKSVQMKKGFYHRIMHD